MNVSVHQIYAIMNVLTLMAATYVSATLGMC